MSTENEQALASAERQVRQDEERLERQRQLIKMQAQTGSVEEESVRLYRLFKETLAKHRTRLEELSRSK